MLMQMKRITASEQIYKEMHSQIMFLELKPGEELNMQKLLQNAGVSRSPLRDALLKLQEDNLVEIFPQKGSQISRINLKQVEVERFMRSTLELAVIPLFAKACTKEHLLKMRRALEEQKFALEITDQKAFLNADDDFHKVFFSATGKERIWDLIQSQSGNYRRIRFLSNQVPEILNNIIGEHERILNSFSEGQMEECLLLDKKHLTRLIAEIDILETKYPGYFE